MGEVGARRRDRSAVTIPPIGHRWIADQDEFESVVDALLAEPRYALDTEFHRERTYFPKLALVQFAWPGELVLVDPLAVDVTSMRRLFDSDVLAVLHAAQQDLDVLTHSVGAVPRRLYDTQVAAGFVGYGTPSLVSLLQGELKVSPAKGDRLTDWLRRPLSTDQCQYAASDVAYLLDLHERLTARLSDLGRTAWAEEACEELLARPVSGAAPLDAWQRLKDVRTLRPRGRAVAQALAAWREQRAMANDTPVRQVLPDLAVLGIAQRQPRNDRELAQARGVDDRFTRGEIARQILAAVAQGLEAEPPALSGGGDELDRDLRPAVSLVSAWVSQVARDERIDTSILATRADLVALLRGDEDARLASGWRAELLGSGVRKLVEGRAGLTFDGRGGLRLVDL
jgi:ribonuclease D